MEYDVTTEKTIDFGATGEAEILQNVWSIITSMMYSCPLARGFAWSPDVDAPLPVAQAKTVAKLIAAIREHEPRAEVIKVSFEGDGATGHLKPVVKVRIANGAV